MSPKHSGSIKDFYAIFIMIYAKYTLEYEHVEPKIYGGGWFLVDFADFSSEGDFL